MSLTSVIVWLKEITCPRLHRSSPATPPPFMVAELVLSSSLRVYLPYRLPFCSPLRSLLSICIATEIFLLLPLVLPRFLRQQHRDRFVAQRWDACERIYEPDLLPGHDLSSGSRVSVHILER